ncbi:MAG: DNA repair protein RecN [Chloroflexota bacterium]
MLLELRAKNIGIIEEISWSLSPGLNVITGETGAGKSLVIDAVEALLGARLDEGSIRHGANEAQIEGVFALGQGEGLKQLLAENGIAADEESLVISCGLRRQGRSIVRVNGHAVPRSLMHQIGRFLVDVHGQSEHLSLRDKKYHLDFLDAYGHTLSRRQDFGAKVGELSEAEQELKTLVAEGENLARRREFLSFQVDEIKRAKLKEGEEGELEQERNILASSEKLKALSGEAYQALYREETSGSATSVLSRLSEAISTMKRLVELDPAQKPLLNSLETALYGLEEVARDIRAYSERMEYDPQRLEEVGSRLELIRNLKRKYGQTVAETLDFKDTVERELAGLSHSAERQAQLERICASLKEEMGRMAFELSQARSRTAKRLVTEVEKELGDLNMSQIKFAVSITQALAPEGIPSPDGGTYAFTSEGVDNLEFMVSTNPGEPLKPLAKIASTGEISRFMLALKGALSQADNIPVLVFDEIDIGVGGRSGEIIGQKLWRLARNRQVICVTHLPQLAVFADAHYSVHKEVSRARTISMLATLKDGPRLQELAVMLGGQQYTETSLDNARELIGRAQTWKARDSQEL